MKRDMAAEGEIEGTPGNQHTCRHIWLPCNQVLKDKRVNTNLTITCEYHPDNNTSHISLFSAEATWAMMTVIIILVVVIIFCCALPFYRALEKRWHHWDDLGNDPRWDVENFQFSPTSPQISRDPKYNRLSICSTDNGSSMGTSTSGINRGDSFRNNSAMPR